MTKPKYEPPPIQAADSMDCTDVMEAVAHFQDGPEPPAAIAQAWLDKHALNIEEAMHVAAMDYIAEHWTEKL